MIQAIIDAIAEALFQEFGADHEIHTEKVEQGLIPKSFIIRCLNPTKARHLGRCYLRTNQFSIQYIPESAEVQYECASVLERLFDCLEDVTVSGRIVHGTGLHGEVTDDVLTFIVNYDGFVLKEIEQIPMEVLDAVETDVKG